MMNDNKGILLIALATFYILYEFIITNSLICQIGGKECDFGLHLLEYSG